MRRPAAIGAAGTALFAVIAAVSPSDGHREKKEEPIKHILTDSSTRTVALDSLAYDVKRLSGELREQEQLIARIKDEMKKREDALRDREKRLVEEIARMKISSQGETSQAQKAAADVFSKQDAPAVNSLSDNLEAHGRRFRGSGQSVNSNALETTNDFGISDDQGFFPERNFSKAHAPNSPQKEFQEYQRAVRGYERHSMKTAKEQSKERSAEKTKSESFYLTAGTLMSGQLITGLDAPTGENARNEPYPALIRLTGHAVGPHGKKIGVDGCMLVAAGYGDMSSERVYLRAESIACKGYEGPIAGYITGEDGKAGIRGRLVSKQGKLIARAMVAGFLDGFGSMFSSTPVTSVQTGSEVSSTKVYQRTLSPEALQSAAFSGAGKALDRISKFYLGLAEKLFPVLEVDASRKIDIVLTASLPAPSKKQEEAKRAGVRSR